MAIKANMCGFDRGLRILGSLLLIYIGFIDTQITGNMIVNYLIGGFGLLNLVSALAGFCPIYFMARISSLRDTK